MIWFSIFFPFSVILESQAGHDKPVVLAQGFLDTPPGMVYFHDISSRYGVMRQVQEVGLLVELYPFPYTNANTPPR